MKNQVSTGKTFDYVVPENETVTSGQYITSGGLKGFAVTSGAEGETVAVQQNGVYTYAKATSQAWAQGDSLYFDATAKKLTKTAGDNLFVGFAFEAAEASDTEGNVVLIPTANSDFTQAALVADPTPGNLTAVPGSFADVAAVRTYLLTLVSELETYRDANDAKIAAILTSLKNADLMASA